MLFEHKCVLALCVHCVPPYNDQNTPSVFFLYAKISVPVAQWLEHCVSSAKVVGSIPREHMY